MNNLLIWPLNETDKIIFVSEKATLATITCCDLLDLYLQTEEAKYKIVSSFTGCQLSTFKNELMQLLDQSKEARLSEHFSVCSSQLGHILVKMSQQNMALAYFMLSTETIKAWIAQLSLLEVVLEENENEQKTRGTGCC